MRTLQKRVEWLEAKDSFKNVKDWDKHASDDVIKLHTEYHAPAPAASYVASAPVVEYMLPAVFYVASAPVVEYIAPATSHVTPASVVDNIAPTLAVDDVPSLIGEYISPAPGVYAAPVPVLEYIAPAPSVDVAPAPVGGCISPVSGEYAAPASVPVVEYISPAPMEFVEAALHEIDKEPCRDEIEELCCVVRMSQKRIWRRVWQSCSAPSDASKSERTWRALSARLCYEQESGKSECPDVWIRLPRHKRENS